VAKELLSALRQPLPEHDGHDGHDDDGVDGDGDVESGGDDDDVHHCH